MDLEVLKIASNTKNHKVLKNATHFSKLKNPICGDEMDIGIRIIDKKIKDFGYQCKSCIYCQASVSLLSRKSINKSTDKIKNLIQNHIDNNEVCLFMKGTPDSPQCGFSMAVSNVLKHLKVNFKGINVLEDEKLRQGIKEFSDWPTIPQLYVRKEFIGGCDIVKEMFEKGELKKLFEEKKII